MLWKYAFHVCIFPFCRRDIGEQKLSWKYAKIVVKPKVISCFRNKTKNRRKDKIDLKTDAGTKIKGLNMGWNGR